MGFNWKKPVKFVTDHVVRDIKQLTNPVGLIKEYSKNPLGRGDADSKEITSWFKKEPAPADPVEAARTHQLELDRGGLRDQMQAEARKFREQSGGFKQEQYKMAGDEARTQLDSTLTGVKQNANARGLLFSGLRQGAEAQSRAGMASMLAQQRAEINREADELANSYDQAAAQVGLDGYDDALKDSREQYDTTMEAVKRRQAAMAQIGQGVGYGLGRYYGREKDPVVVDQTKTGKK